MTRRLSSKFALVAVLALGLATTGCTTVNGPKQGMGMVGGAVAGAALGSVFGSGSGKIAMIGVGTLLGALAGSEIGASLDRADQAYMQQAYNSVPSAPVGQAIRWNNPQSGNYGTYTVTRDGYAPAGEYCREYQQTIVVGGRSQQAYGTACRQPDGQWRVIG